MPTGKMFRRAWVTDTQVQEKVNLLVRKVKESSRTQIPIGVIERCLVEENIYRSDWYVRIAKGLKKEGFTISTE
jgi:hypothetical protein